ncbi:uncharacterized protein PHACADRAFT_183025 [Phanerochaete carnosa HHB-10118-sp]|uniref:Uncharacterized protein n=1 Tax=Phanerochaete carnosa (strain HHB-10118-sp) TaxID=650164 RepID=K5VXH1_PHACS|nr:uncharacterized protein PHACADRAFT_183025 [Phanerochaete carnosa HHB-10118-sp]EKM56273.1 hypothetical protein PHACADRAFT_183025 [Phanerochaete carnosa HHB-10118-sp]
MASPSTSPSPACVLHVWGAAPSPDFARKPCHEHELGQPSVCGLQSTEDEVPAGLTFRSDLRANTRFFPTCHNHRQGYFVSSGRLGWAGRRGRTWFAALPLSFCARCTRQGQQRRRRSPAQGEGRDDGGPEARGHERVPNVDRQVPVTPISKKARACPSPRYQDPPAQSAAGAVAGCAPESAGGPISVAGAPPQTFISITDGAELAAASLVPSDSHSYVGVPDAQSACFSEAGYGYAAQAPFPVPPELQMPYAAAAWYVDDRAGYYVLDNGASAYAACYAEQPGGLLYAHGAAM